MHPYRLTVTTVGHNQLLLESVFFDIWLCFWKEITFLSLAAAHEDLKLTRFPCRNEKVVFPTKNCYQHKSAPSDLTLRSEARSGRRQDYAPVFPSFTVLWCTKSGEEAGIFLIKRMRRAWNIGLTWGLHLQYVFFPLLAPSLSLILSVFSANALELEDRGRRPGPSLLKPFYRCPTSSASFLCNYDPVELKYPPVPTKSAI